MPAPHYASGSRTGFTARYTESKLTARSISRSTCPRAQGGGLLAWRGSERRQRQTEHAGELRLAVRLGEQKNAGVEPTMVDDRIMGIAGREQHFERCTSLGDLFSKLRAVHVAGHDHIGKQQIEVRSAINNCKGLGCVPSR